MQDMDALPVEHFAGLDVAVDELNHVTSRAKAADPHTPSRRPFGEQIAALTNR
jgi:hypothetical protein